MFHRRHLVRLNHRPFLVRFLRRSVWTAAANSQGDTPNEHTGTRDVGNKSTGMLFMCLYVTLLRFPREKHRGWVHVENIFMGSPSCAAVVGNGT